MGARTESSASFHCAANQFHALRNRERLHRWRDHRANASDRRGRWGASCVLVAGQRRPVLSAVNPIGDTVQPPRSELWAPGAELWASRGELCQRRGTTRRSSRRGVTTSGRAVGTSRRVVSKARDRADWFAARRYHFGASCGQFAARCVHCAGPIGLVRDGALQLRVELWAVRSELYP